MKFNKGDLVEIISIEALMELVPGAPYEEAKDYHDQFYNKVLTVERCGHALCIIVDEHGLKKQVLTDALKLKNPLNDVF